MFINGICYYEYPWVYIVEYLNIILTDVMTKYMYDYIVHTNERKMIKMDSFCS